MASPDSEKPIGVVAKWLAKQGVSYRKQPVLIAHKAARSGMINVLIWLTTQRGVSIHSVDEAGRSFMHDAAAYSQIPLMEWLYAIDKNFVHVRDKNGRTPAHAALLGKRQSLAALKWLNRRGADLHARTDKGCMLSHLAAIIGQMSVLKWLAENGHDFSAVDNEGSTLLHEAAQRGEIDIVQWLGERKVNVRVRDNQGRTPLHRAAMVGPRLVSHIAAYRDTLECLLAWGADPNAKDKDGMTPLQIAEKSKNSLRYVSVEWFLAHSGK